MYTGKCSMPPLQIWYLLMKYWISLISKCFICFVTNKKQILNKGISFYNKRPSGPSVEGVCENQVFSCLLEDIDSSWIRLRKTTLTCLLDVINSSWKYQINDDSFFKSLFSMKFNRWKGIFT